MNKPTTYASQREDFSGRGFSSGLYFRENWAGKAFGEAS